jgi:hypothetical protein
LLGVSEATVALYSPIALPLALERGGFIFLAIGLSPLPAAKTYRVQTVRKGGQRRASKRRRPAVRD